MGRWKIATALLTAGAVVSGLLAACSDSPSNKAGGTSRVTITSPARDAIVDGPAVKVSATVTGNPSGVQGWVADKSTTLAKSGSSWSASLREGVVPGLNTIRVKATTGSALSSALQRVFVTGVPGDLGLAVTNAPADDGQHVRVDLGHSVAAAQASVNGHPIRAELPVQKGSAVVDLGAADGLQSGANTVTVTVITEDGTYQRVGTVVNAPAPALVASAGPYGRGRIGVPYRFDATATRPSWGGGKVAYDWTIAQAPPGSKATVTGATTARPSLVPDAPGTYVVRLRATQPGSQTSTDFMHLIVPAYTPPIGLLLHTQSAGPNTITLGGQLLVWNNGAAAVPASLAANQPGALMAVFDRETLALLLVDSVGATGAGTLVSDLSTAQGETSRGVIAVVSSPSGIGGPAPNTSWEPLLQALGVDDAKKPDQWDENVQAGNPFSVVSILGGKLTPNWTAQTWRSSFNGTQAPPTSDVLGADLSGYLGPSDNGAGAFTFIPNTYVPFDTSGTSTATTNTMQFAHCQTGPSCTFPSPPLSICSTPGRTGGFQVAILYSTTLQLLENQSFTTNSGCGTDGTEGDDPALANMTTLLNKYSSETGKGDYLLAVQSIGAPRPQTSTLDGPWSSLASALVPWGGTASVLYGLGWGSGYTLVGSNSLTAPGSDRPDARETSTDAPALHPSARISGLLTRNHRNDLAPTLMAVGGPWETNLSASLYGDGVPWPVPCLAGNQQAACAPGTTPTGEQQALAYITQTVAPNFSSLFIVDAANDGLCYDTVHPVSNTFRASYCNTAIGQGLWNSISRYFCNSSGHTNCQWLDVPKTHPGFNFSASDWRAVVEQLYKETKDITTLKGKLKDYQAPAQVLANGGTTGFDLQSLVTTLVKSLDLPSPTSSRSIAFYVDIVAVIAGIVWAVAGAAGATYAVLAAGAGIVSELATISSAGVNTYDNGSGGEPDLVSKVHTTMGLVVSDLESRYSMIPQQIGYLGQIAVTDWAKLEAVANGQGAGTSSHWAKVTGTLETSALAWAYPLVMSAAFAPNSLGRWTVDPPCTAPKGCPYSGDAANYSCNYYIEESDDDIPEPYSPYPTVTEQGQYLALGATPTRYVLSGPGNPTDDQEFNPPTSSITPPLAPPQVLSAMFAPVLSYGDQNHLGIFKPHLYEHSFDLSKATNVMCRNAGTPPFQRMAATASAPGAANVFYFTNQSPPAVTNIYSGNGRWDGPGPMQGAPDTSSGLAAADGNVFFVQKGKLVVDTYGPNGWQAPAVLPGTPADKTPLAASGTGPNDVRVFFNSRDGLVNDWWDGKQWNGPNRVPGRPDDAFGFAAVEDIPGQSMHFFFVQDGQLNNDWWTPAQQWQGPAGLPGAVDSHSPLAAVSQQPGDIHLFFVQGGLLNNDWYSPPAPWQGPAALATQSDPGTGISAVVTGPGNIDVYAVSNRALVFDYWRDGWHEALVPYSR